MSHSNHQSYGYRNSQNDGYSRSQDYRSNPNVQDYPSSQRQQYHHQQPHQQQHYRSPPPPEQNLNSRDVYCDPKFYGDENECQLNIEGILSPLKQLDVNSIPSEIMLKTNRIGDVVASVSNNGRPGNDYRPAGRHQPNNYQQHDDRHESGYAEQPSYYNRLRQQQHQQSRGEGGNGYGNSRQTDQGNQHTSNDYSGWDGPEIDHWTPAPESKVSEEPEPQKSPVPEEFEEPQQLEHQQQSQHRPQQQHRVHDQQAQQRDREQQPQQRVYEQQPQQRGYEQPQQQRVHEQQPQQRVHEQHQQQRGHDQYQQQRGQQYQPPQPVHQQHLQHHRPQQQFQQHRPNQQYQQQRSPQQFQQQRPQHHYQQQRYQQSQQQQQSTARSFNFNLSAKEFKPNVVYYQQQAPAPPVETMPPSSQWMSDGDVGNFGGPKLEQLLNGDMDEGELLGDDHESHFVWENVIQTINQLTVDPGAFNRSSKKMISVLQHYLHEPLTLDLILTFIIEQSVTTPNFCYTGARLCEALRNSDISVQIEGAGPKLIKNAMVERVHLEFSGVMESLKYDGSAETQERARGMIMFTAELYLNLTIHSQGKTRKNKLFGLACLEIMETLLKFRPVHFENAKTVFQALKLMGWDFEQETEPKCKEWFEKVMSEAKNINEDPETDRRSQGIVTTLIDLRAKNWNKEVTENPVESNVHNPYKDSCAGVTQAYELPETVDDDDEYVDDQPEEFQRAYEEFLQMTAK